MNEIILILGVVFFILWLRPHFYANSVIQSWLAENKLSLLDKQLRLIRVGPFFHHRNRAVYKVIVETAEGNKRNAWIMIGDVFLINPQKYRVVWEEEENNSIAFAQNMFFLLNALFYFMVFIIMAILLYMTIFDTDLGIGSYFIEEAKIWD
jgi:hypothetical protein